jgi:hypothetical protein
LLTNSIRGATTPSLAIGSSALNTSEEIPLMEAAVSRWDTLERDGISGEKAILTAHNG